MTIHVVREGETITSIAAQYGVSAGRLIQDNRLTDYENLVVGQTVVILYPNQVHTVQAGETLTGIARQYGITTKELLQNNPTLAERTYLYPGETIIISYIRDQGEEREIGVNGYVYPFIDKTVLMQALPYLTYLTIFTYGFRVDGTLVEIDDIELIALAKMYEVAPIMLISTLTPDGTFSNELAHQIFVNETARQQLIDNVVNQMKQKGYYGLDVDFEYILPEDRQAYVEFIQSLHDRLSTEGFILITALAPKTSAEQRGLLYEAHDYAALGAASDYVLVMTYEWGYTYGPPMAVAPLNKVREVIAYAVTEVPSEKIFQGIPNYGYRWMLPYVRGESQAMSLGNEEAVQLAAQYGASIQFDERAASPFFYFTDEEARANVVWFEDARSIQAKLRLNAEFDLYGISYWNLMRPFAQNWLVLVGMTRIRNVYREN